MPTVNVKWGKESYEVESTDPALSTFQALLFSLTQVPPERQKLMCKGKMIKDDAGVAGLKDGDKLVLMGSADAAPKEPAKQVVFEEDLTDAQKIGVVKDVLSAGLHNLGNTCYMASTLQCMRAVPELKQALIARSRAAAGVGHDPNAAVVRQLGALYGEMERTTNPITPMMFTTVFRSTFPQFAETSPEGHWMQQDAEEAMIQLMNSMANVLKAEGAASGSNQNVIDQYFGGEMETRTKLKPMPGSEESAAAASAASSSADEKVEIEQYRRLRCFIDSTTNFLFQGLKAGLSEERELRGQIYQRESKLLTLPRYLIVQMMRFGWRNDSKQKTKILRKVDFPVKLDVIEFAAPALKKQLSGARNFIKDEQDEKLGLTSLNKKPKTEAGQTAGSATAAAAAADASAAAAAGAPMEVDASNPWAAGGSSSADNVLSTPTSGNYEIFALVTHKGRTSDSGHYVSWAKQNDGQWLKFDDEKVSRVTEDEVKALHGGGDADMSYLLFYRRIDDAVKFQGRVIPESMPAVDFSKKDTKTNAPAAASSSSSKA